MYGDQMPPDGYWLRAAISPGRNNVAMWNGHYLCAPSRPGYYLVSTGWVVANYYWDD